MTADRSVKATQAHQATTGAGSVQRSRPSADLTALIVMAVLGLGISIYLTTVHYSNAKLVCTAGGIVDCQEVTQSAYSVIGSTGIPITIPGMIWFILSGGLAIAAWMARDRTDGLQERIAVAHVVWGGAGLIAVLYFVYAEIVKLQKICEWCTGVHILTLLSFLVALYRLQKLLGPADDDYEIAEDPVS